MKDIQAYKKRTTKKLMSAFSSLNEKQAEKITERYVSAVQAEIISKFTYEPEHSGSDYIISLQKVNQKSRSSIDGKQQYMENWFRGNAPLYSIINMGDNIKKKHTEIKMNYSLDILDIMTKMDEAPLNENQAAQRLKEIYSEADRELLNTGEVEWVDIDLDSLKNYITYLKQDIQKVGKYSNKGQQTVVKRLRRAWRMYEAARIFGSQLPQVVHESPFGRKYFKSLNLQTAHKALRHAALGDCISYDIENSVFAWRYSTAKAIDSDVLLPHTLEYLDNKEMIRKALAETLNLDINKVKEAFTAISFGATGTKSYAAWTSSAGEKLYPALNEIIEYNEARKEFLGNEWVSAFINEQKQISRIIFDYVSNTDDIKIIPEIKKADGKLHKGKTLSYLYQQHERTLLDTVVECLDSDNVLLTVHDGIYIKKDQKAAIREAKYKLKEINSELNLDRTEIIANYNHAEIINEEQLHKQRNAQQERQAKGYKNVYTDDIQVSSDTQLMKMMQDLVDYNERNLH